MEFIHEVDRIYANDENGRVVAEVTFPAAGPDTVVIDHTYVDPSLRGAGVAGKLMKAAYERIKNEGKKATATCSYAVSWFERNEGYRDVLE